MKIISTFVSLTILAIVTGISLNGADAASVTFSSATATFFEPENNWAPSQMIDGIFVAPGGINGWSIFQYSAGYGSPGTTSSQTALLTIANPLTAGGYALTFNIFQNYFGNPGHILGDFALSYTTDTSPTLSSAQTPVFIQNALSLNGTTFSSLSANELLTHNPAGTDTFAISALIDAASPVTGIFLDVLKNPALPSDGPGQFANGNFVVTEFVMDASLTTPIPAALPLFASGLGVLGLLGWRRKRSSKNTN